MRAHFEDVKVVRPEATRGASMEVYLVGLRLQGRRALSLAQPFCGGAGGWGHCLAQPLRCLTVPSKRSLTLYFSKAPSLAAFSVLASRAETSFSAGA